MLKIDGNGDGVEGVSPLGVRRHARVTAPGEQRFGPLQGPAPSGARGGEEGVLFQFTWRSESFQKDSRSLNFWILPVAVRASSSRNSTRFGIL